MNTDHSEFINRYSRTTEPYTSKKHNRLHVVLLVGIVLLYLVSVIYIIRLANMDQSTIILAISVFLMASALAFITRRTQNLLRRQERELDLMNEVFEGSRGGRLITDSADNTIYCNGKFKELCASEKKTTYDGLVQMFSDNDQVAALFRSLSEQAHRGLADSIELYCEKPD